MYRTVCLLCVVIFFPFLYVARAEDVPGTDTATTETASPACSPAESDAVPDAEVGSAHVAVVDLGKVLRGCRESRQVYGEFTREVEEAHARLRDHQAAALRMSLSPKNRDPWRGSCNSLTLFAENALMPRRLADRQAEVFHNTFQKSTRIIARYAQANDLRLVIQAPADSDDATYDVTQRQLAKHIAFYHGIEITADIIRCMDESSDSPMSEGAGSVDASGVTGNFDRALGLALVDLEKVIEASSEFQRRCREIADDLQTTEGLPVLELEITRRNNEVFEDVFLKCKQNIEEYAVTHDLQLVLQGSTIMRHDGAQSIRNGLNRICLYHHGIDITAEIIRMMNPGAAPNTANRLNDKPPREVKLKTDGAATIATFNLENAIIADAVLQDELDRLQGDENAARKVDERLSARINAALKRLEQARPQTEGADDEEANLREQRNALCQRIIRRGRKLTHRRDEAYVDALRRLKEAVAEFAAEKHVYLVAQFGPEPVGFPFQPALDAKLGEFILYQRGIDITDEIIGRVARHANGAP